MGAQGAPAPPTLTGRGQSPPPPPHFWTVYCTISYCMLVHFFYYMHLIISSVHDQFHFDKFTHKNHAMEWCGQCGRGKGKGNAEML